LSYTTLNGTGVFIDLNLATGLALLYLTLLRYWNHNRRAHWCSVLPPTTDDILVWTIVGRSPWLESELDHLIDILEGLSNRCRIIVPDVHLPPFQQLRWPELAMHAAIVGPESELLKIRDRFSLAVLHLAKPVQPIVRLKPNSTRDALAAIVVKSWGAHANVIKGKSNNDSV
jgi:hypothetical protein